MTATEGYTDRVFCPICDTRLEPDDDGHYWSSPECGTKVATPILPVIALKAGWRTQA